MVPLELAAWHAGLGEMVIDGEARSNPNLFTIGIELANHGYLHRDEDGRFWWELGRELKRYRRAPPEASTLTYDNGVEIGGWWEPYPEAQVEALERLMAKLKEAGYANHIAGHEEIAMPLGRKRDPGALFPWARFSPPGTRRTTSA